ncbi:probable L-type lectin-domain containing receptor kinase S.5 [Aristolochia californica]|uniref:probable L-type lectin-domain containing receptor kinase S.5 n=1 Tax=Aristolochia californica TaxID=171875 RepID=UPI0035D8EC7E
MFTSYLLFSLFIHQAFSYRAIIDPVTLNYTVIFSYFDVADCGPRGSLLCMGGATVTGGSLDLNPDPPQITNGTESSGPGTVGRVLYKIPILVWPAMFTTTFTAVLSEDANSTNYGDGMTFILAPDDGPGPDDSHGGFLGLFNHTTKGHVFNQLAVEMDTYKNELDPPNANHIGIDTKSIESDVTFDLDDIGIDLKSGRDLTVTIAYDGWNKNLGISVCYKGGPSKLVLDHHIDLSVSFPKAMYVGFTGSTGGSSHEKHRIRDWVLSSMPLTQSAVADGGTKSNKVQYILIIALPVVLGGLFLFVLVLLFTRTKCGCTRERKVKKEDIESRSRTAVNGPKLFPFKQLSKATQNFSKDNLLGTGGFGSVYKGEVSDPPDIVAVKRMSATSKQGEKEFLAEICTIGRLRHKNIVQLLGWCHESDHLLLVYEFMPNGSLDRYISKGFLDWPTRYEILTGLASALLYLHEECGQTVVHRDVKPNNVMLDAEFNAHLGDFGLARLLHNETPVTTMLAGTPGYLAPESSYTGKATIESDVFSFGIVVLEVLCGRRSWGAGVGENNLVDHIWDLHGKGELLQGVDSRLEGKFESEEMKRALLVALACSHPDPALRPKIRKVVHVLTNPNEPLMNLPESRPTAIYVPVLSPRASMTTLGSMATTSSGFSNTQTPFGDASLGNGR